MELNFRDYTVKQAANQFFNNDYLVPAENKIGVFTAAKSNMTGEFRWLKNMDQLKDFMLNIWFPVLTEDRDAEYYRHMKEIKKVLEDDMTSYETIMELTENNPFAEDCIIWIGSIERLIHHESHFASQVRDHFNEDRPITEKNRHEFIEFLEDYMWA